MFGATADRSRCLQNGEKSRCTFRTNVQCLDSFREYHANADSNTSKLFLFTPAPPPPPPPPPSYKTLQGISKTKCWGLVIISHQWKGAGWVGGFCSPNDPPPSKSSDPFLPPPFPLQGDQWLLPEPYWKIKFKKNREKKKIIQQSLPAETLVVFDGVTMSAYGRPK